MIVVRVIGWSPDGAWVDWSDHHRQYLEDQLAVLTDLSKQAARRISRGIRDRRCEEVRLSGSVGRFDAERFRSFLESLGAVAIAEDA